MNSFSVYDEYNEFNEFEPQETIFQDESIQIKQKIKTYIDSIELYKNSIQTMNVDKSIIWLPEYEIIDEELKEIYNNVDNNYIDALDQFNSLEITNYPSFKDYVINTNIRAKNHLKGNLARIKSIRSPRGESLKCKCGGTYHLLGTEFVCDRCDNRRSYDKKMPGNVHKQNMDKHISKQIDVISGIKNLPSNIRILKPYIIKWLLERKYLLEWLEYSNGIEQFCKTMDITMEWFNKVVERIPENKYNYKEYVTIINEFYSMFETCNSINNLRDSDMVPLSDETKIDICKRYYEQFNKIPDKNEIFEGHQIGNYILKLFIVFDKTETEKEIENIFKTSLKVGGMMFNFIDIRKSLSSPPKKFNLTSIYTEVSHLVFNVQYIIIRPNDKIAIERIVKEFNKYYKNKQEEVKTGKFNSPLFYCSLYCILTRLKYFEVYQKILTIIPDKYVRSKSMTLITGMFILFINDNPEFIEPYRHENSLVQETTFNEEVNEILSNE